MCSHIIDITIPAKSHVKGLWEVHSKHPIKVSFDVENQNQGNAAPNWMHPPAIVVGPYFCEFDYLETGCIINSDSDFERINLNGLYFGAFCGNQKSHLSRTGGGFCLFDQSNGGIRLALVSANLVNSGWAIWADNGVYVGGKY